MERWKNGLNKFHKINQWFLTAAWLCFGIFAWFWGDQLTADALRGMLCVACCLLALYNFEKAVNEA